MKLRKTLIGLVCLSSVFTLVACKDKKTTKKTTTNNTTIVKTTTNSTTKKTTTQTTTKKDIPAKYAVNKATYDSFFNPATAEDAISFNVTMEGENKSEGRTTNITLKMASNRALQLIGTTPMNYQTYAVETDGSITVTSYRAKETGWEEERTIKFTSDELNIFVNTNVGPCGFDFDKLTFNYETNTYESNEKLEFDYKMDDITYKFEIKDYTVKFEDNKPVRVFFNRIQEMYNTEGELVETFGSSMTITFSDFGTTVVDPIALNSMS